MLRHPPAVRASDAPETRDVGAINLGVSEVARRGPGRIALFGSLLAAPAAVGVALLGGSLWLTFALLGVPVALTLLAWTGNVDLDALLEQRAVALAAAEDGHVEEAKRALTRLRFRGRRVIEPLVLADLALLDVRFGDLQAARRAAGLSVALSESRASTELTGYANLVLGFVEALRGTASESQEALATAATLVHADHRRAWTVARACLAVRENSYDEAERRLRSILEAGGPPDHEYALARLLLAYSLDRSADHYRDGGGVEPEIDRLLEGLDWDELRYVGSAWSDMATFIGQRARAPQPN